jgi:hypothetical protein
MPGRQTPIGLGNKLIRGWSVHPDIRVQTTSIIDEKPGIAILIAFSPIQEPVHGLRRSQQLNYFWHAFAFHKVSVVSEFGRSGGRRWSTFGEFWVRFDLEQVVVHGIYITGNS